MRENRSRFAVLGALAIAPMSGYDVRRFFEAGISFFWQESYGQIYPILKQLKAEGLATEVPQVETSDLDAPCAEPQTGRRRTVYAITPRGRTALQQWLTAQTEPPRERIEILLKLFFARHAPPEAAIELLTKFREQLQERLAVYDTVDARLREQHATNRDLPYWIATLRFGQLITRAMVAWCDEARVLVDEASDGTANVAYTARHDTQSSDPDNHQEHEHGSNKSQK